MLNNTRCKYKATRSDGIKVNVATYRLNADIRLENRLKETICAHPTCNFRTDQGSIYTLLKPIHPHTETTESQNYIYDVLFNDVKQSHGGFNPSKL